LIDQVAISRHDSEGRLVTSLLAELDAASARQARIAVVLGRRNSDEQPLPVDLAPAEVAASIRGVLARSAVLTGWPHRMPRGISPGMWLSTRLSALRMMTEGGVLLRELGRLADRGYRVIDRPPIRWYAGTCSARCPGDLWVDPERIFVVCPVCKERHDVAQRKEMLMRVVEDSLATATEIGRAGNLFDRPVTPATIWRLANRKRITARGLSSRGEPMYRIGDVLYVLRTSH
jgi:hypothetical protein